MSFENKTSHKLLHLVNALLHWQIRSDREEEGYRSFIIMQNKIPDVMPFDVSFSAIGGMEEYRQSEECGVGALNKLRSNPPIRLKALM